MHPLPAGFVLTAVLAAIMSTMSSQMLVVSTSLIEDLFLIFAKKKPSEQVLITSSNGRIENHAPAVNAFALRASQIDGVATVSPPFGDKTAGVASSVSADGTHVLVQVQTDASVGSITTGTTPKAKTVAQDLDTLADVTNSIVGKSFCALGDGAGSPIVSSLKYFRDEYLAHLDHGLQAHALVALDRLRRGRRPPGEAAGNEV